MPAIWRAYEINAATRLPSFSPPRAHNLNVTSAAGVAEEALQRVKSYVVATPALKEAFDEAIARVADFHEEVVDQNMLVPRATPRRALNGAKREDAVALGVDWF